MVPHGRSQADSTSPMSVGATDVFQALVTDMEPEGRYILLNALANQLRFPNNHTHYFSCLLLHLFETGSEVSIWVLCACVGIGQCVPAGGTSALTAACGRVFVPFPVPLRQCRRPSRVCCSSA